MSNNKITNTVVVILTMMSVSAIMATDIMLPSIPTMVHTFKLTTPEAQSLISSYLIGIAVMQLIYGPISESFGRKTVLVYSIILFGVASFGAVLAHSYVGLIMARLLQALGACACLVLGKAIVGDVCTRDEASKIFLLVFPLVGATCSLAPVVGGWMNNHYGWKASFYFTGGFVAILLVLVIAFLKETKPPEIRVKLHPVTLLHNYIHVLGNLRFWGYTSCVCFSYAAYFSYISEAPFLLVKQGIAESHIGYTFLSLSLAYVLGNMGSRFILRKLCLDRTLMLGYIIFVLGGTVFCAAMFFCPKLFEISILGVSLISLGSGAMLPLGTAGSITATPKSPGASSGVLGFFQLTASALAAQLIGVLSGHDMIKIGLIVLIVVWVGVILNVIFFKMNMKYLRQAGEVIAPHN